MKGFEAIPSQLIDDAALSLQARAVYGVLRKLLWQQTRTSEETMVGEVGTVEEIAAAAGCGETAMKGYLAELRDAGWLTLDRKRRGHPYTLTVYSTPVSTEAESDSVAAAEPPTSEPENGSVQRRNPSHSRAHGSSSGSNKTDGEGAGAPSRQLDEIWDFLEDRFGRVERKTSAHGCRNRAVADLRKLGATSDSLEHAIAAWSRSFPGATITDAALAKHYPLLTVGYQPRDAPTPQPCPECGVGGGFHVEGCPEIGEPADPLDNAEAQHILPSVERLARHGDRVEVAAALPTLAKFGRATRRALLDRVDEIRGETPGAAYERWIQERAGDLPEDEVAVVVASWTDLDDIERQELLEEAERLRERTRCAA